MKKHTHNNFIKYGSLIIKEYKAIELNGDIEKVDEFLQGQVTSDHSQLSNNSYQLSSICNHKGQVMSDFLINKNNNAYRLIINNSLKDALIEELKPFAKLHRVEMHDCNKVVVGKITLKNGLEYPYSSNKDIEVGISVENKDFEHENLISYENWHAANKILGNFLMGPEDVGKYRPIEINYDNLRVSFDKGCYRGQEIVARMKYLGIDRRKFCTLVVNNSYELSQKIKIIGKIIKLDELKVFNAIINRDEIDKVKKSKDIIELI